MQVNRQDASKPRCALDYADCSYTSRSDQSSERSVSQFRTRLAEHAIDGLSNLSKLRELFFSELERR